MSPAAADTTSAAQDSSTATCRRSRPAATAVSCSRSATRPATARWPADSSPSAPPGQRPRERSASLAPRTDVYCGVLLRTRRAGGRDAVTSSHLAWVEIDAADALERLSRFPRTPSMIVSSGTPGHAHAYFALRTRCRARRARAGQPHARTPPRRRPRLRRRQPNPQTRRHPLTQASTARAGRAAAPRTGRPLRARRAPRRPRAGAPPSTAPARRRQRRLAPSSTSCFSRSRAATYVRVLTGLEPHRDGKVNCPFHADDTSQPAALRGRHLLLLRLRRRRQRSTTSPDGCGASRRRGARSSNSARGFAGTRACGLR